MPNTPLAGDALIDEFLLDHEFSAAYEILIDARECHSAKLQGSQAFSHSARFGLGLFGRSTSWILHVRRC
jgi:hypothetical protein